MVPVEFIPSAAARIQEVRRRNSVAASEDKTNSGMSIKLKTKLRALEQSGKNTVQIRNLLNAESLNGVVPVFQGNGHEKNLKTVDLLN